VDELIRTKYVLKHFSFSEIGRWWHGGEEIDIIALNEATKDIVFAECKWQKLSQKEAKRVLFDLQEKANTLSGTSKKKRIFCDICQKIEGKEALRKSGFLAWDMED